MRSRGETYATLTTLSMLGFLMIIPGMTLSAMKDATCPDSEENT